ncbi:hypothetical protein DZG00_03095 [Clavibacter lycopersici]|uniref:DUF4190 domain-containing protein n=1 Tax=Clavibacter lycopersici TaxID=2301718 RepID=A0A399T9B0_9MICO|nr:DUF4190 domain-containing protein [Clavibacter lycopersici]RIJ52876.1 hypothetical protein DZG00_03095 [Clavibacter lycopersici]RIJ62580.1 hypothetical protein DZG02_00960 [Clavibacter lycopersici]
MTFRYAPEPDTSAPRERKTFNGVGLAALIVGVLSLIGSVIPILNYVSGFLAVVGIVLGIIGLILRDRPKGMALGGLIASVVALILSIVLAIVYTVGIATVIGDAVEDSRSSTSPVPLPEPQGVETPDDGSAVGDVTVSYELTGTVPAVSAAWTSLVGEVLGAEEAESQPLPFTREVVLPGGSEFDDERLILVGTGGAEEGDVTCRVLVGGTVLTEQTSSGSAARAACVVTAAEIRAAVG